MAVEDRRSARGIWRLVAVAGLVVLVVIAGALSLSVFMSSGRTTVTVTSTNTATSTIGLGLNLELNLNSTHLITGQSINATVDVRNILGAENNVSAASLWALPSLEAWSKQLTCPSYISVELYRGAFSLSNVTGAEPLQIGNPSVIPPCATPNTGPFLFRPYSDVATSLASSSSLQFSRMYRPVVANGYFAGEDSSTFVKFPADEYTVVAGDEWGQLSIAYFTVIAG